MPIDAVYPFTRPAAFPFPRIIQRAAPIHVRVAIASCDAARRRSFLAFRFYFLFLVFSCMALSVRGRVCDRIQTIDARLRACSIRFPK
jgi:hypothetical protein